MSEETRPVVLIVDDDESDRVNMSTILERDGFHVMTATSGGDGLAAFLEHSVRVVVTDIVMTDGDGVSLIAWLRSLKPTAAIVAVSGKGEAGLQAAVGMGAREALRKPMDAKALVRSVRAAAERRDELEALRGE